MHNHRTERPKEPSVRAADSVPVRVKRRAHWDNRDTTLALIAALELCFFPYSLHTLISPTIVHFSKLETIPFGLVLLSLTTGIIISIITFIILCYLLRKHAYSLVLGIMIAVLLFELLAPPAAAAIRKMNLSHTKQPGTP